MEWFTEPQTTAVFVDLINDGLAGRASRSKIMSAETKLLVDTKMTAN